LKIQVKGDLAVVGTFTPGRIGSINAAGKKNVDGNRAMAKVDHAMAVQGAMRINNIQDPQTNVLISDITDIH